MLGEGIVSFGVACVADRRKAKSSPKIAPLWCRRLTIRYGTKLQSTPPVSRPERHLHGRRVELLDAADAELEIHQPVVAAEFAVGHALQADILLHAYAPARPPYPRCGATPRARCGRPHDRRAPAAIRRTQQAAHMVGAERRHLALPMFVCLAADCISCRAEGAQGGPRGCDGNIRGGAWRLVGGLGVEEDAPADARRRPRAVDADLYGARRARASRQRRGEPRHAYPGHRRGARDGRPATT